MDDLLAEQVIDAVQVHPGMTYYGLSRLLRVDETTLRLATQRLSDEGRLRSERRPSSLRWYEAGTDVPQPPPGDITPGSRAWNALAVTAAARSRGIAQANLEEQIPVNSAYVDRIMRRLEDAGLVVEVDGQNRWVATPIGRERAEAELARKGRARKLRAS